MMLGEYPGYYCYDANRSSLLPYWIDNPTESACKWNPATVTGNLYHCATGQPDCGNPSTAAQDPTKSGPGVAPAGDPTNVPRCSTFQVYNPEKNACEFNIMSPSLLLLGAALVAGIILIGGRRG